ncbi:MAG: cob(I)yrinic acid a,c-diamide adenosyltransferase [Rikenellaceae bacterium]
MRVYTKGGDKGSTSLISGERVKKYDMRVEAYGTVDELSAFIALLSDKMRSYEELSDYNDELLKINSMLMNIESHLAAGEQSSYPLPAITEQSIADLERSIDRMQAALPAIDKFTIPGGCKINSLCHICRTVCRRAERRSVEVSESYLLDHAVISYLNRLSDYLYLLGRYSSMSLNCAENLWIP